MLVRCVVAAELPEVFEVVSVSAYRAGHAERLGNGRVRVRFQGQTSELPAHGRVWIVQRDVKPSNGNGRGQMSLRFGAP